jgi:hypothetical protein
MTQLKYYNGASWVTAVVGAQGPQGDTGTQGSPATTTNVLFTAPLEKVTVSSTVISNLVMAALDITTSGSFLYTSNPTNSYTINIMGPGTVLSSGQSVTVAFMVTNGSSAYLPSYYQIDGYTTNTTFYWQGGVAPTAANASTVDVYTFTIICTSTSTTPHTYKILASQVKF